MYISLIPLLVLTGGASFAVALYPKWVYLDIKDPLGSMQDVPPAGFEPFNDNGGGGDVPLYICLTWQNGHYITGRLVFRPSGELNCYVTHLGKEIAVRFNARNYQNIFVLKTPPECYDWVPFDSSSEHPSNYVSSASLADHQATPICRVYDSGTGYLIPGLIGHRYGNKYKCWYSYHGERSSQYNIEVLVWSQYALLNIQKCDKF